MKFKYKTITKKEVQDRQDNLNNPKGRKNIFKAKQDPQVVRIIPYVHNQNGNPFIERNFHYGLAGGTIVCPTTYGQSCPVCQFASQLWRKGEQDMAKKFFKSDRVYVPVLERSNMESEPKFWGVSRTNYQDILNTIADPDYGDVIHPFDGRDLTVTKIPQGQYGKVVLKFKPQTSAIAEKQQQMEKILNSCPNFDDVYPLKKGDELEEVLQKTINGQQATEQKKPQEVKTGGNKQYMTQITQALG